MGVSAMAWTPEFIRSRDWSFAVLRKLARECRDLAEGEAILEAFWRKVERDPQRHGRQTLPMLLDSVWILEARAAARGEKRA
jgi:hypothetical protein